MWTSFHRFCFVFQISACVLCLALGEYGTAAWALGFAGLAVWAARNQ